MTARGGSALKVSESSGRPRAVLITGASSGIGYELTKCFAEGGYHLVLVARDRRRLEAVAAERQREYKVGVSVLPYDLSLPQAPGELFSAVRGEAVQVEVLVNNAGFGSHGDFAHTEFSSQLEMLQVNVVALTHLTRLFLPEMIARHSGRILNVASTAAFQPGPLMAVYYASKAYVLSFSEALANELGGTGVTVTALCPGPTTTEFQRRAGVENTPLMSGRIMSAKAVAAAGYQGLLAGKTVVVPGIRNRVLAFAVRFLPRRVVAQAVRAIQETRKSG